MVRSMTWTCSGADLAVVDPGGGGGEVARDPRAGRGDWWGAGRWRGRARRLRSGRVEADVVLEQAGHRPVAGLGDRVGGLQPRGRGSSGRGPGAAPAPRRRSRRALRPRRRTGRRREPRGRARAPPSPHRPRRRPGERAGPVLVGNVLVGTVVLVVGRDGLLGAPREEVLLGAQRRELLVGQAGAELVDGVVVGEPHGQPVGPEVPCGVGGGFHRRGHAPSIEHMFEQHQSPIGAISITPNGSSMDRMCACPIGVLAWLSCQDTETHARAPANGRQRFGQGERPRVEGLADDRALDADGREPGQGAHVVEGRHAARGHHRGVRPLAHRAQQVGVRAGEGAVAADVGDDVARAALASRRARTSQRSPPSETQPRAARRCSPSRILTSSPTATRSPCSRWPSRTTRGPRARRSRCSPARSRWRGRGAATSSSRMPPESST